MKVHELKAWPDAYAAVRYGHKRFEIRRDDRGFSVGDIVVLREFVPDVDDVRAAYANEREMFVKDVEIGFTGREAGPFSIGYVERSACLPEGWCGFSLVKLVPKIEEG